MEKKEILETLQKFGLNEYESRTYVSLVFLGPSKASNISREAKIPQSKIYDILEELMRKQLIEVFDGRPKEFKAILPQTALRCLLEEREEQLKFLKERATIISNLLKPIAPKEEILEGIWVQKGDKYLEVMNRLAEMLDRAKKYVFDVTRDFSYSSKYRESIKKCVRRNVKIKIIGMQINKTNYYRAKWYHAHNIPLRIFEADIHPRILIVDGREVSVRLDHNPLKKRFSFHSIWSQDPSLVTVLDSYMKNLWEKAKPLDFRKIPEPKTA